MFSMVAGPIDIPINSICEFLNGIQSIKVLNYYAVPETNINRSTTHFNFWKKFSRKKLKQKQSNGFLK